MGLAGRKEKQRIPNDPRNLSWADDANKFGAAYLQKLGWSAGTGLGTTGEGRTSHIKVHQKLDMLGIGAAHQKDPNGLAWKQNRDFENLLKRLNAAGGEGASDEEQLKISGFAKGKDESVAEAEVDQSPRKKRKRGADSEEVGNEDVEESKDERKKKKKDKKKEKKETKDEDAAEEEKVTESTPEAPSEPVRPRPPIGRPVRAHRARFMASKNIASKSSAAIDEILGISRSGTSTPYPTTSMSDTPTEPSSSSTPSEGGLKLQELTVSTKSVMDYFKEKLLSKSNASSSNSSSMASTSATTPREAEGAYDDYDDRLRGGLGLGFGAGSSKSGLGASRLRSEVTYEEQREETARAGLGAFSRMSTMFSAAKSTSGPSETVVENIEVKVIEEEAVFDDGEKRKKKDKGKKRHRDEERAEGSSDDVDVQVKDKRKRKKKDKTERAERMVEAVSEEKVSKKEKKKHKRHADGVEDEAEQTAKPAKKPKKDKKREVDPEETAEKDVEKSKRKKSKKVKSSESVASDS